jgi:energy-converting hydrogenase Eha subunit A
MTAAQLIGLITAAVFVFVLVVVVVRAVRRPSRESIDIALFFVAPAIAIMQGWVARAIGVEGATVSLVAGALILAIPLLTLRAIRGFTELPRFVLPAATVAWGASAIVVVAAPTPMPPPLIV